LGSSELKYKFLFFFTAICIITFSINDGYSAALKDENIPPAYWIFFLDRGLDPYHLDLKIANLQRTFSVKSVERRQRSGLKDIFDESDLPVSQKYIDELTKIKGIELRHSSRWLNAVSVNITDAALQIASNKQFVSHIQSVRYFYRHAEPFIELDDDHLEDDFINPRPNRDWNYEYGRTLRQNLFLNIPRIHDLGLTGSGIIIGVLDAGFDNLDHNCFADIDIIDSWDFVNDDDEVGDENDAGSGSHGTKTLSIIAGFERDEFVGVAFDAAFILGKTENTDWERRIEEDHWVAGLEWMDELGAEVVSSSLSYFDWYEYEDMDGETGVTTVVAKRAVDVGIIICSSMGNSGRNEYPADKMGAPSDADGVFSIGATNTDSSFASWSSQGPTFDGRIKPDFTTLGSSVNFAGSRNNENYGSGFGTSFSAPAIAGLCALLLQANPLLNPTSMREVLRGVSNNNEEPDTLLGWGIPDGFAAVELVGFEEAVLEIDLEAGWSTISHNLLVDFMNVPEIVSELVDRENLIRVKDGQGRFFSPADNFNNIPHWNYLEGYQFLMREDDELIIEGITVSYTYPIDLVAGWQIVSYLPTFSMASPLAFQSLADENNLILAKDDQGRFYLPLFDFSNMPPCRLGSGYNIKLRRDDVLIYPRQRLVDAAYPEYRLPQEYSLPEPDESGMSVLIVAGEGVNDLDEIAFRDLSGNIIGAGVVVDGNCGIALWAGNNSTVFPDAEYFSYENQEFNDLPLKRVFGPSEYTPDEVAVYQAVPNQLKKVDSVQSMGISLHPNPFNNMITIKLGFRPESAIRLSIYNSLGQKVLSEHWGTGSSLVKVIGSNHWASGNYYFQINHNGKMWLATARHLK